VQLTGVKHVEKGRLAVEFVAEQMRAIEAAHPGALTADASKLRAAGYRVCLINSDYDVGFRIKRDLLHRCLRQNYPDTLCAYEPCIYQGLKIKFMWNDAPEAASTPQGVCMCGEVDGTGRTCIGRGFGHEPGDCRKVTVAVFQSGKVVVTGAHTLAQLNDAYRFFVGDVVANRSETFRMPPPTLSLKAVKQSVE
jgi:hypothetical protein